MEIDENIITTEIDKLLELVSERGQVSVEKASEELGIPNDRIKTWAEALEEDGLIERVYSARKGTVLKKKKKEEAEKEIYKFKEEVEEELGDIIEIVKKREGLKELEKDLKNIKNTLEDCEGFKDEKTLDEIVKIVQKDEKELKSKEAEEAIVNVLEGVEKEIENLEEGDIEDLERKKKSVEENLKKFKGGRKHHRIIEKAEKETERKSHRCSECGRNFYTKRGLKVHHKKMHEKKEKEKSGVLKKLKNIFNIR